MWPRSKEEVPFFDHFNNITDVSKGPPTATPIIPNLSIIHRFHHVPPLLKGDRLQNQSLSPVALANNILPRWLWRSTSVPPAFRTPVAPSCPRNSSLSPCHRPVTAHLEPGPKKKRRKDDRKTTGRVDAKKHHDTWPMEIQRFPQVQEKHGHKPHLKVPRFSCKNQVAVSEDRLTG